MAGNPLLALAVEPPDVAGNFIAGQKDATTQRASRLSAMIDQFKLKQAQSAEDKSNALEQLYQTNGPGIASGDENALAQLAKVDPNAAIETKGKLATQAASKATTDKSKFDLMKEQVGLAGSGAQSILNAPAEYRPMLWAGLKQKLKAAGGFDPTGMPEEYSDAAVRQLSDMSMSAKDQLDQHQKATDAANKAANEPFTAGPDGKPVANQAVQNYELKKAAAPAAARPNTADEAGWQLANDPTTNTQYRINVRTGATVGLDGKPYAPKGAAKINSGTARSGQAMAMQKFMQENPDATSDDVARFAGHYAKTVAATGGETKADVASLTQTTKLYDTSHAQEQSINGAIGQITALMNKGAGTSMGPVVNRWLQAGKKATGDKDVAAFNTAVETAANEYAKLITGSTAATDASRAEASTMLDKFQSPEALMAQIAVIQKDGHFKVQSYADRKDAIQARIDGGGGKSAAATDSGKLPDGVTEEDIQHTLKLHPETTRAQLLQKLGGK